MKLMALVFMLLIQAQVVAANDNSSMSPAQRTLAPLLEEEALGLCVHWYAGVNGSMTAKIDFMKMYAQRYMAQSGRELFLQTFNLNNWISYYHATQAMAKNEAISDIGDHDVILPDEILAQAADQQALSTRWGAILKPWQKRSFDRLSERTKVLMRFLATSEGKQYVVQRCFSGDQKPFNYFVEDLAKKDTVLSYHMITFAILASALIATEVAAVKSAAALRAGAGTAEPAAIASQGTLLLVGHSILNGLAKASGPAAPAIAAYWGRLRELGERIQASSYLSGFFRQMAKLPFIGRTLKWLASAMASGIAFDSVYNLAAGDQKSAVEIIKNKLAASKTLTPGELTLIRQFCTDVIQADKQGVQTQVTRIDLASSPSCLLPSTQHRIEKEITIHQEIQQGLMRIMDGFGPNMTIPILNLCAGGFNGALPVY